jgi:hypothetical protein
MDSFTSCSNLFLFTPNGRICDANTTQDSTMASNSKIYDKIGATCERFNDTAKVVVSSDFPSDEQKSLIKLYQK